jgi:hypothetical protein
MVAAMRPSLLAVLVLSGCWLSGREVRDKIEADADTDADADVDGTIEVKPPYGSSAGVTIIGSTVVAVTPPGPPGEVAVEVRSAAGTVVADAAIRYWEDGGGRAAAAGEVNWNHYQGDYWEASAVDYGTAWVQFVHPASIAYADLWGGLLDSCQTDVTHTFDVETYDAGTTIALEPPTGAPIELTWNPTDLEFQADLLDGQWAPDTAYELSMGGAAPFPALDVDDFLVTPDNVRITSPNVDGTIPGVIGPSFSLEWSGPFTGDYAVARLIRYDEYGVPQDVVRCMLTDDGSFDVPAGVWDDWPLPYFDPSQQVTIIVGRVHVSQATLPHNGGRVEVAGVRYAIGAVFTL